MCVFHENPDVTAFWTDHAGLSGVEALEQMRKLRRKAKEPVASGYSQQIGRACFSGRPYWPLDLLRPIEDVVNSNDENLGA